MTIIVVRDGEMAADSVGWTANNSVKIPRSDKIIRLGDGSLLGCAGPTAEVEGFKSHMLYRAALPRFDRSECFTALRLKADGTLWLCDHSAVFFQLEGAFMAIGSPNQFAFGCLFAGASARKTVQLCIDHTDGAGGHVQSETLS